MRTAIPVIAATAAVILGGAAAIELMPTSYEVGVSAYSQGDYTKAARQFRDAAANGQAESQFMLGRLHAMGLGLPQDLVQAYVWHSRAATQGHAGAIAALANLRAVLTPEALARAETLTATADAGRVPAAGGMLDAPPRISADAPVAAAQKSPADLVDITRVQARLAELGYFLGTADGVYNTELANAISEYQQRSGLKSTGTLTPELMASLNLEAPGAKKRQTGLSAQGPSRPAIDRDTVLAVQRQLVALGYEPGPIDGILGPRTRSAIEAWQEAAGMKSDGQATPDVASAILAQRKDGPPSQTTAARSGGERSKVVSIAAAPSATEAAADPGRGAGDRTTPDAPAKVAKSGPPVTEAAVAVRSGSASSTTEGKGTPADAAPQDRGQRRSIVSAGLDVSPPSSDASASPATPAPTIDPKLAELQRELAYHGYLEGRPTGSLDEATRGAIRNYQRDAGLAVTGAPSPGLLDHVRYSWPQLVQDQGRTPN